MKKTIALIFASLLALTSGVTAVGAKKDSRKNKDISEYFAARIAGDAARTYEGTKKVALRDVERMRDMVWEEWKKANAAADESRLPATGPLAEAADMSWDIPSELEPDAVMPYVYGCKGESAEARPFFIFLHGSGPKAQEWKTLKQIAAAYDDAPSVYFIPQIPNEGEWYRWYQRGKQWAWERLLRQALLRDEIDADKVYFMGISEGAYGSQRLASYYADYLAGAGPMAGGEPLVNAPAENLRNTAFVLRTGQRDFGFYRNVLTRIAAIKLDSLQQLYPGHYDYMVELIPDAGHGINYMPTAPWLRKHKRNPYPKSVYWENFEMDGRYRDGFYNLYVDERSNDDESQRTCYEMNINGNEVDVTVSLVKYEPSLVGNDFGFPISLDFRKTYVPATKGRFTVYLNDSLVDMSKEVTLRVNGREVFRGKVKPSLEDMVNSCARYYERARIYPASIKVEI